MTEFERIYKLVMLGDEAVGKTSLIVQHTEHRFEQNYMMTIGTDISAKLVEIEKKGTKINIYLIIWDIGGQEKYQILRESYLRGASGALLVFDLTNKSSFHHVYRWKDEAERFCGKKMPMLLIGNKVDLTSDRIVKQEESEKLANELNMEYLETSAKSGEKVNLAFNKIVTQILKNI